MTKSLGLAFQMFLASGVLNFFASLLLVAVLAFETNFAMAILYSVLLGLNMWDVLNRLSRD